MTPLELEILQVINQIPAAVEKAFTAFIERHPGHGNQKTHGNRFGAGQAKESLRRLKDDKGAREAYKQRHRNRQTDISVPQGKETDYARGLFIATGRKDRNKVAIINEAAKASEFMKASGREQEYVSRLTKAAKQAGLSDAEILGVAEGVGGKRGRLDQEAIATRHREAKDLLRERNRMIAGKGKAPVVKPRPQLKPTPSSASDSSRLDTLLTGNKSVNLGKAQGKTGEIEFQLTGGTRRDPDTLIIQARKVGSGEKWAKVHFGNRSESLSQSFGKIKEKYGWDISPSVSGNPFKPTKPRRKKPKGGNWVSFPRGRQ